MEEKSIRDAARDIGISPATLLRIEQSKPCGSDTLATILLWLIRNEQERK
jgi:DNA-binding XRE family transcriptional regulator